MNIIFVQSQNNQGLYSIILFEMLSQRNKMAEVSRFKTIAGSSQKNHIRESPKQLVRFKTEGGESEREDQLFRTFSNKKSFTSRKSTDFSLENLLRDGSKRRKMCLERIVPQYKAIIRPAVLDTNSFLSKQEKQNVRRTILDAINEPPRKSKKVTEHHEKLLRVSFNKIVREFKQRNYIRREDEAQVFRNKIQGYGASIKGEKHNVNQDSLIFSEKVFIVCDGHGTNGKQISEFVCHLAHKLLVETLAEGRLDQAVIKHILKKVEVELDLFGIDIAFSGCTFIGAVIHENMVYCINVGDSKAVLCQGLGITEISTLHKPDNPIERQRIQMCGGVIHPLQIGKDKYSGPNRIWAPGKASWGPGLALSRAFGDKAAKKYGVISQPQIKTFNLCYQDDYIILGSDGLFDYMKDIDLSMQVRKYLKQQVQKQEIPLRLAEQSRKASVDSDDISCIIIFL